MSLKKPQTNKTQNHKKPQTNKKPPTNKKPKPTKPNQTNKKSPKQEIKSPKMQFALVINLAMPKHFQRNRSARECDILK